MLTQRQTLEVKQLFAEVHMRWERFTKKENVHQIDPSYSLTSVRERNIYGRKAFLWMDYSVTYILMKFKKKTMAMKSRINSI